MPFISQIFWVFNSVGMFGKWINPFSFYVGLYVVLAIILWVIVIIFGAAAGASYKDDQLKKYLYFNNLMSIFKVYDQKIREKR